MKTASAQLEQRALHTSIGVAAAHGAVGVPWGIFARSQMILLDGVSAVVGIDHPDDNHPDDNHPDDNHPDIHHPDEDQRSS